MRLRALAYVDPCLGDPKRSETAVVSEHATAYVELRLGGPKRSETAVSSEYALAYVTLRLGYVGASFC